MRISIRGNYNLDSSAAPAIHALFSLNPFNSHSTIGGRPVRWVQGVAFRSPDGKLEPCPFVRSWHGETLHRTGRHSEAASYLKRGRNDRQLLQLALDCGDLRSASALARRVDCKATIFNLAGHLWAAGQREEAAAHLQESRMLEQASR